MVFPSVEDALYWPGRLHTRHKHIPVSEEIVNRRACGLELARRPQPPTATAQQQRYSPAMELGDLTGMCIMWMS